jgi:hypothetical protein
VGHGSKWGTPYPQIFAIFCGKSMKINQNHLNQPISVPKLFCAHPWEAESRVVNSALSSWLVSVACVWTLGRDFHGDFGQH